MCFLVHRIKSLKKCAVMVRFSRHKERARIMDRVRYLSVLRLVLPMVVLAASVASVQAGSAQAPAPVRAVVARPAPPMMQAPRQAGAAPANNFRGTGINAPPPNAAPTFSPRFQMGGQMTPVISGSEVGAAPQQAGRFNFAPPPGSGGLGGSSNTTAPASASSPPARVVFTPAPPVQTTMTAPKFSTAGPTTPMVQAPQQPTHITIAPTPNPQSTPATNSIPAPTRITLTPIQPQQNQIATPALSAAVAGPTTPMVQAPQPTRITIAPTSNPQSPSPPNSGGYNSGAGIPVAPGINSWPGITASGNNSAPGISTGPAIASGMGIRSGGGIPVESSANNRSGSRDLPATSAVTYDSGSGLRVGPGLAASGYSSGSGITSRQIESGPLPPIAPTGSSGITASTTNRPVSADATNASGGIFGQLYASIKSTLHPTALFTVETIHGSEKSVAVDTIRGLPKATEDVGIGFAQGSASALKNIAVGTTEGVVGVVKGTAGAVTHPVQTIENAATVVEHPVQTSKSIVDTGIAVGQNAVKSTVQGAEQFGADINSGNGQAVGRTLGNVYTNVGSALIPGVGEVGGAAKGATAVTDAARTVETTRAIEAGSAVASKGTQSANLIQTGRQLQAVTTAVKVGDTSTLLATSEASGGHLIAQHVALTESDLASRLASQPSIQAASTFRSQSEAEAAVSKALAQNSNKVNTWAASGSKGNLILDTPFSGGSVLVRGSSEAVGGTGARVILRGNGQGGFYVLTGYPTP